jgi:hypothetical protein
MTDAFDFGGLEFDPDYDFSTFPDVVLSVLEQLPDRDEWLGKWQEQPGLSVVPPDEDGWLRVLHHGETFCEIHRDTFLAGPPEGFVGLARARDADGQWAELEIHSEGPLVEIDPDEVRGELPDDLFERVDWSRLHGFIQNAILGQKHDVRSALFDMGSPGRRGLRVDVSLSPFDADGYTVVKVAGVPILRLHVSNLLD